MQIVLLLARSLGRRLRVPGDGVFLVAGSALICLIVAADALLLPRA